MSNGAMAVAGPTYYVDASNGDDTRTDLEAQNPAMPWRTIKKALDTGGLATTVKQGMPSGYTVIVKPGVYNESVEPKRDGFPDAQVIIQASSPGSVTIAPPSVTNAFSISHRHHVVDGFVVTGAINRLKMGPHDPGGTGPVVGLIVRNNEVHNNSGNAAHTNTQFGIYIKDEIDHQVWHNTVYNIVLRPEWRQLHALGEFTARQW